MAYQIDDITAVQTPDPLPENAVSQPGYFTDGDPSDKGLGATFVPAWWLNMVQGELVAICQKANIRPDKTNNAQVVTAILTLVQQQGSNLLSSLETALNAETQRAQAAEAGFVPLNGSKWMSGQLVVASGELTDNTQADGFSARFKEGSISAKFTVGLDAQNYPYASVSFFDQNGGFHQWQFGANNRITTPNGGVVLEVLPSEDKHLWAHNYGGDDRQLAWLDDVSAERTRAQAAEAGFVPLNGSRWMNGQLVVASGPLTDNTQADGFSARFKEGSISAKFTVGLDAQN